jgi:KUP system potassium uptake protein
VYSLFHIHPKRADVYWFIHVNVLDVPYTTEYEVTTMIPKKVFRIDFNLGFRVEPRINLFFRKVLEELSARGEVDLLSRYNSLRVNEIPGDLRFVVLRKELSYESSLPWFDQFIMEGYFMLRRFSLSEERSFGLDTSSVTTETVPLVLSPAKGFELKRVDDQPSTPEIITPSRW